MRSMRCRRALGISSSARGANARSASRRPGCVPEPCNPVPCAARGGPPRRAAWRSAAPAGVQALGRRSSSISDWIIASIEGSAGKPIALARLEAAWASRRRSSAIIASGCQSIGRRRRARDPLQPSAMSAPRGIEGRISERFHPQSGRQVVRADEGVDAVAASSGIIVGATGQVASPVSGSRMIEEAKVDAARFGLPGRTTMVGRRRMRPSRSPCGCSRRQQLADHLLHAVGGLRRQRLVVVQRLGQVAAIGGDRRGEHDSRAQPSARAASSTARCRRD